MSWPTDDFLEDLYDLNSLSGSRASRTADNDDERVCGMYDVSKRWERPLVASTTPSEKSLKAESTFLPPIVGSMPMVQYSQGRHSVTSPICYDDLGDKNRGHGNGISQDVYDNLNNEIDLLNGTITWRDGKRQRVENAIGRVEKSKEELYANLDGPDAETRRTKKSVFVHLPPPEMQRKHQLWENRQKLCAQMAADRLKQSMAQGFRGLTVPHELLHRSGREIQEEMEAERRRVKLALLQKVKPERVKHKKKDEENTYGRKNQDDDWLSDTPPLISTSVNINAGISFPAVQSTHQSMVKTGVDSRGNVTKHQVDDRVEMPLNIGNGKREKLSLTVKIPSAAIEGQHTHSRCDDWDDNAYPAKKDKKSSKKKMRKYRHAVGDVSDVDIVPHPPTQPQQFNRYQQDADSSTLVDQQPNESSDGWKRHNTAQSVSSIVPHPPLVPRDNVSSYKRGQRHTEDSDLALAGHKKLSESSIVPHPPLITEVKRPAVGVLAGCNDNRLHQQIDSADLSHISEKIAIAKSAIVPHPPICPKPTRLMIENEKQQDRQTTAFEKYSGNELSFGNPSTYAEPQRQLMMPLPPVTVPHPPMTKTHPPMTTPRLTVTVPRPPAMVPHAPVVPHMSQEPVRTWTSDAARRGVGFKSKQRREAEKAALEAAEMVATGSTASNVSNTPKNLTAEARRRWRKETMFH